MNKQELIERYKTKYAEEPKDWKHPSVNASRQDLFANFIRDLERLDEPQRETIPKCAHEFILEGTGLGLSYFEIITSAESFANAKPQDEFSKWLRKNSGLFIRSLLNGYEVEKEPEYHVILSKNTGGWKYTFLDEEGSIDRTNNKAHIPTFTEKKVKAIDQRYWAFAVPVEEVEEG